MRPGAAAPAGLGVAVDEVDRRQRLLVVRRRARYARRAYADEVAGDLRALFKGHFPPGAVMAGLRRRRAGQVGTGIQHPGVAIAMDVGALADGAHLRIVEQRAFGAR